MKQTKFYLVGTVHKDPDGPQRLEALLQRVKPEIIAIETSEQRINKPDSKKDGKWPELEDVRRKFELTPKQFDKFAALCEFYSQIHGYEIRVSQQYATQHSSVQLEYVDTAVNSDIF